MTIIISHSLRSDTQDILWEIQSFIFLIVKTVEYPNYGSKQQNIFQLQEKVRIFSLKE